MGQPSLARQRVGLRTVAAIVYRQKFACAASALASTIAENFPEETMPAHKFSHLTRRRLLAGAAATSTLLAAPSVVRAQGGPLKVGVLLPKSGFQASIGQDCQRGVDI